MKEYKDVSAQSVSWLKSNRIALERNQNAIKHLLYPENTEEFSKLILNLYREKKSFDLIGWSSNTLFMPTYQIDYLVCTKLINQWHETDNEIICDCGVPVSKLARTCVEKGYKGYYGLIELPGTIAAAVYGNCGCYDCTVMELVRYVELLTPNGNIVHITPHDMNPQVRSTALKSGKLRGTIINVALKKDLGNREEEIEKSKQVQRIRHATQPNGVNNLGSTFVLGKTLSSHGHKYYSIKGIIQKCLHINNRSFLQAMTLALMGGYRFTPYLFDLGRWMFRDNKSYDLLFEYEKFIKKMFPDAHFEIEIRK